MATEQMEKDSAQRQNKTKKRCGAKFVILVIVFLLLFLVTTAILGAQLYKMATRDQYTVDLGMGEPEGSIELFRIEYENAQGEVTVSGANGDNVVAPGTTVNYDIRLRNKDDVIIDFAMLPEVDYLTKDIVPVEFKIVDDYGNYILGSDAHWATAEEMNDLVHKGSIHPGEVFTYHVSWQWVFEKSDAQDAYDSYLGSQDGQVLPGIRVGVATEAVANAKPVKSNSHMMHLVGEGFGCCWCCYLLWFLLLICLLMILWVWRLRRKLAKQEELIEEYEEMLKTNGLPMEGAQEE